MKSPIDLNSHSARFSQKLRGLARSLHPAEQQQRTSEPAEYVVTHTPDRPRRSAGPDEIPSDIECAAIILGMQEREEERRQAKTRLNNDARLTRWPPVAKSWSAPENWGEAAGKKGSEVPVLQQANPSALARIPHGWRWENPRSAPRPELGVYDPEPSRDFPRAGMGSLRTVERLPAPHHTEVRHHAPRKVENEGFGGRAATSMARGGSQDNHRALLKREKQEADVQGTSWYRTRRRESNSSTQARVGTLSSDEEDENDNVDDVCVTPLSPRSRHQSSPLTPSPISNTRAVSAAGRHARSVVGAGKCRMPTCTAFARHSGGLCDACEADFMPPSSMFADTTNTRRHGGSGAANRFGFPAPRGRANRPDAPSAQTRLGHIAHQMRIISPPESPREIAVRVSPTAERKGGAGPEAPKAREGRATAVKERRETPSREKGGAVSEPSTRTAGAAEAPRRRHTTALAYIRQIQARQQQRSRSPRRSAENRSLVLSSGDVRAARRVEDGAAAPARTASARVSRAGSAIMDDWAGSEYYLMPAPAAGDDGAYSESEYEDEPVAAEADDGDGAGGEDRDGLRASRSAQLRELWHDLGARDAESERGHVEAVVSPVLSGMRWSGGKGERYSSVSRTGDWPWMAGSGMENAI